MASKDTSPKLKWVFHERFIQFGATRAGQKREIAYSSLES